MDSQFWIKAWNEGRTNFHRTSYHEKLLQYFPQLEPLKGQKVLVPLCGKTKDLLWLSDAGLDVHGIELHEQAVKDFFLENELPLPTAVRDRDFIHRSHQNIVISCGDFFGLEKEEEYDFIYDRGSLVALPSTMRENYARLVGRALKRGGKYLLIVYEYDPSKMEGPPFSIDDQEIARLFENQFTIRLMESEKPKLEGSRLSSVESLRQNIYILEKQKGSGLRLDATR